MVKNGILHHIGFAVTDMQETKSLFARNGYVADTILYDEALQVELCYLHKPETVSIELVRQLNPEALENRLIGQVGATVYHLCYEVPDLDLAYQELLGQGYQPLFSPVSVEVLNGSRICYFHHPHLGYIELLQR
ncbi:MAG: VOC family protein [Bacteroides sp.]|nr:VOC family protein [Bacteroides sp.]